MGESALNQFLPQAFRAPSKAFMLESVCCVMAKDGGLRAPLPFLRWLEKLGWWQEVFVFAPGPLEAGSAVSLHCRARS